MRYRDIPKFTRQGNYAIDLTPDYLLKWIEKEVTEAGLILCPDFQRGHVWTKKQQEAYVTYILRGGCSGRDLYFNCPWWNYKPLGEYYEEYTCVDGLQRITAWREFFNDKFPVYGHFCSEFTDRYPNGYTMRIHVNDLKTRREVLQWYLEMNSGGTPHSKEELAKVKKLLEEER